MTIADKLREEAGRLALAGADLEPVAYTLLSLADALDEKARELAAIDHWGTEARVPTLLDIAESLGRGQRIDY